MNIASRRPIIYTVDYLDGYQYESGKLLFFPTAEGYVKYTVGVSNPDCADLQSVPKIKINIKKRS